MLQVAPYHREEALRKRINTFLVEAFALPASDYYANLSDRHLLGIKAALSDINNALTLRLTLRFIEWLEATLPLTASAADLLRDTALKSKPSSNGFDVYSADPVPLVAEVKCNIPINGSAKYGSAQRAGILKDIEALRSGKPKGAKVSADTLRFMVFVDLPEVRRANEHLSRTSASPLALLEPNEVPRDPSVVYGIYVALGA